MDENLERKKIKQNFDMVYFIWNYKK